MQSLMELMNMPEESLVMEAIKDAKDIIRLSLVKNNFLIKY